MNPKYRFLSLLFIIGIVSLTTLSSQRVDASVAGVIDDVLKVAKECRGGAILAGGALFQNGVVVIGLGVAGVAVLGLWALKGKG